MCQELQDIFVAAEIILNSRAPSYHEVDIQLSLLTLNTVLQGTENGLL